MITPHRHHARSRAHATMEAFGLVILALLCYVVLATVGVLLGNTPTAISPVPTPVEQGTNGALIQDLNAGGHNITNAATISATNFAGTGTNAFAPASGSTNYLRPANNLSDLGSAATARTNLGLGTASTANVTALLQSANNLSDLANASTARTNLGLGGLATVTPGTGVAAAAANAVNTAGGALTLGAAGFSGEDRDSRPAVTVPVEGGSVAASGTITLASISGGPGNVEFLQVGISTPGYAATFNSVITIQVDGGSVMSCDMPTFFCYAGSQGASSPYVTWANDEWRVTALDNYYYSGGADASQRIYIPFNSTCVIKLINGDATASHGIYSQITYRLGAPPPSAYGYGVLKKVFHMVEETGTLTAYSTGTLLPTVSAAGEIGSIILCVNGSLSSSDPSWLEANPALTLDGNNYDAWGGTEDFFGGSFGDGYIPSQMTCTPSWGFPISRQETGPPSSFPTLYNYATSMYRNYIKDPRPFTTSAALTWSNGQTGQGPTPPTVNFSSRVIYYTTQ